MLMAGTGISTGGSSDRNRGKNSGARVCARQVLFSKTAGGWGKESLIEARERWGSSSRWSRWNLRRWTLFDRPLSSAWRPLFGHLLDQGQYISEDGLFCIWK